MHGAGPVGAGRHDRVRRQVLKQIGDAAALHGAGAGSPIVNVTALRVASCTASILVNLPSRS